MPDQTITCRTCGNEFVFTESEQQFFRERGLENTPSRCPDCRREARAGRSSGRSSERTMTEVTCSSCGKPTRVPFVPTAGRPVYCSDCFQRERGSGGGRDGGGRRQSFR